MTVLEWQVEKERYETTLREIQGLAFRNEQRVDQERARRLRAERELGVWRAVIEDIAAKVEDPKLTNGAFARLVVSEIDKLQGRPYPDDLGVAPFEGMSLNEYQELAMRTANRDTLDYSTAASGLAGESGEVNEIYKKWHAHNHPFDRDDWIKEVGDVLWYVACAGEVVGASLGEIAQRNIDKLRQRYPEGFTTERSLNREMELDCA